MIMRIERGPLMSTFLEGFPELDQVLEGSIDLFSFVHPFTGRRNAVPLEVSEDEQATTVVAELPGVDKNEVHISFEEGVLTISGERKAAELPRDAARLRKEIPSGSFSRSIEVTHRVEAAGITAELAQGVLKVVLPKAAEARPRRIEVH